MNRQRENTDENAYAPQVRPRAVETKRRGTKHTAAAPQEQWQDQSRTFLGGEAHPWRRLFARTLDYCIPGFLLGFFLFFSQTSSLVGSIIVCLVWMPMEALFLCLFGATPARWLYGIRVTHPDGKLLTFGEAIKRSFLVFVLGQGCTTIIGIITSLLAYRRLTKTGTTRWDTATNAVVTHTQWGIGRALACVLCTVFAFMLLGGAQGG